jgi:hypothetical protein
MGSTVACPSPPSLQSPLQAQNCQAICKPCPTKGVFHGHRTILQPCSTIRCTVNITWRGPVLSRPALKQSVPPGNTFYSLSPINMAPQDNLATVQAMYAAFGRGECPLAATARACTPKAPSPCRACHQVPMHSPHPSLARPPGSFRQLSVHAVHGYEHGWWQHLLLGILCLVIHCHVPSQAPTASLKAGVLRVCIRLVGPGIANLAGVAGGRSAAAKACCQQCMCL